MPKIMYAAKMDSSTKCPSCQAEITSIGSALYACRSGHVIECVIIVTLRPKPATEAKTDLAKTLVAGTRPS